MRTTKNIKILEEGIFSLENQNINHAYICFQKVLEINPNDKTASYYFSKS
jgi:hypothetical protein